MQLTVGNKIYYRGRGPCLIGAVVQKVVCGTSTSFYKLALLDNSNAELFVPVDDRQANFRALLDRSEIAKLLDHLKTRTGVIKDFATAKNWRQRNAEMLKLLNSGSAFDLADVVESLTQLKAVKNLAMNEVEALRRAKELLACEISEVMAESRSAADARINAALGCK